MFASPRTQPQAVRLRITTVMIGSEPIRVELRLGRQRPSHAEATDRALGVPKRTDTSVTNGQQGPREDLALGWPFGLVAGSALPLESTFQARVHLRTPGPYGIGNRWSGTGTSGHRQHARIPGHSGFTPTAWEVGAGTGSSPSPVTHPLEVTRLK